MKLLLSIMLGLLIMLQVMLWSGPGSYAEVTSLKTKIKLQQQENSELKAKNNLIAAKIHSLKNDYVEIEHRARTELGMIKEGETLLIMNDVKPH